MGRPKKNNYTLQRIDIELYDILKDEKRRFEKQGIDMSIRGASKRIAIWYKQNKGNKVIAIDLFGKKK